MAKPAVAKRKVKWLRYVLLGMGGLAVYHILTGPSGVVNLLRLKRENAEQARELDSLRTRRRKQYTKLKVYAGPDHPHQAQQPREFVVEYLPPR
jgi:cell division protein FtsB